MTKVRKNRLRRETVARPEFTCLTYQDNVENQGLHLGGDVCTVSSPRQRAAKPRYCFYRHVRRLKTLKTRAKNTGTFFLTEPHITIQSILVARVGVLESHPGWHHSAQALLRAWDSASVVSTIKLELEICTACTCVFLGSSGRKFKDATASIKSRQDPPNSHTARLPTWLVNALVTAI